MDYVFPDTFQTLVLLENVLVLLILHQQSVLHISQLVLLIYGLLLQLSIPLLQSFDLSQFTFNIIRNQFSLIAGG